MIKNIVFDFGGVIVDINRDKAVQTFMNIGLKDAEKRLDKYHQTGIFQELEEGHLSAEGFRVKLGELCNRELSTEEVKQAWMGFITGINLDKLDYMTELKKSYRIYLLSNTNPYVMSWACSPQFSSQGKSLADYCDKLYLSYQIGYTKPSPLIFNFMLKDSGMIPSETLFVDDGASNIQIGKELGFQTYQPQNGADWRDDLSKLLK